MVRIAISCFVKLYSFTPTLMCVFNPLYVVAQSVKFACGLRLTELFNPLCTAAIKL
jgi:hypothetical protein